MAKIINEVKEEQYVMRGKKLITEKALYESKN